MPTPEENQLTPGQCLPAPPSSAWSVRYMGLATWGHAFAVRHESGFNGEWYPDRDLFRAWVPVEMEIGEWPFREDPDTKCSVCHRLRDVTDWLESILPNTSPTGRRSGAAECSEQPTTTDHAR